MRIPPLDGLSEIGRRPSLGAYLADAWRCREFGVYLAGYRLVSGLIENRLGLVWILLRPLLTALVYGLIFNFVLSGAARPDDFVPFLLVGVFVFEFFSGCFSGGARAITGNQKLVQSLGFPRILLPVAVVIEQAMRMAPVVLLLGALLLIFGAPFRWSWLLVVPILVMMAVFNLGIALIVARMSAWLRDVQQLIPIASRVLFYASSIFFQLDVVLSDHPVLLTIAHLVPTYDFIALVRSAMLLEHPASPLVLIAAPVWTVAAIVVGFVYFWRAEARYGLSA